MVQSSSSEQMVRLSLLFIENVDVHEDNLPSLVETRNSLLNDHFLEATIFCLVEGHDACKDSIVLLFPNK